MFYYRISIWRSIAQEIMNNLPDARVVEKKSKFLFIGFDSFCMSTIKVSAMTHEKMRKVSTLSCQENVAKQAYYIVQSSQSGRITLSHVKSY